MSVGWPEFQTAMNGCEAVLRRVPGERWNAPSPCEDWTAQDVAAHLIGAIRWGTGLIAGETGPPPASPQPITGDVFTSWQSARRGLETTITPEALERRVRWPFGEQTIDRGLGLFSLEVLVHTWDIARAAELDVALDPVLVHDHFARVQRVGHLLRGPGMYGQELPAAPEADEQDRLLAFLGRPVH